MSVLVDNEIKYIFPSITKLISLIYIKSVNWWKFNTDWKIANLILALLSLHKKGKILIYLVFDLIDV